MLDSLQLDDHTNWRSEATNGLTVQLPPAWKVSPRSLLPHLSGPKDVLSVATGPFVEEDRGCAHLPIDSIAAMSPADAFIAVFERSDGAPLDGFPDRPSSIGPTFGGDGATGDLGACLEQIGAPQPWLRWMSFRSDDRAFYVAVAIGNDATAQRRSEVWGILNSLVIGGRRG